MELRVVIFKEGDWWVAQCLEIDVAAQATGLISDVIREFRRVVAVRVAACKAEGIEPFRVGPAPVPFHDAFKKGMKLEFVEDREPQVPSHYWEFAGGRQEIRLSA